VEDAEHRVAAEGAEANVAIPVHGNPLTTTFSSLALWTR
jgi:hypothetical protein